MEAYDENLNLLKHRQRLIFSIFNNADFPLGKQDGYSKAGIGAGKSSHQFSFESAGLWERELPRGRYTVEPDGQSITLAALHESPEKHALQPGRRLSGSKAD